MFNIGWSEYLVIAVIALIAIGPKELPGVLRMVGQWVAKARKMAAEFQGQFQEAMREAEMADLKKSFDEVKEAATGFAGGEVITSLQKDVNSALNIADIDKPATVETSAAPVEVATPIDESTPAAPAASQEHVAQEHVAQEHAVQEPATHAAAIAHEGGSADAHHDADKEVKAS